MANDEQKDPGQDDSTSVSFEFTANDYRQDLLRKVNLRKLQTFEEKAHGEEEKGLIRFYNELSVHESGSVCLR